VVSGTGHCLLTWVHESSLMLLVVVLHEVGEQFRRWPSFGDMGAQILIDVVWWWCCMRQVSSLRHWPSFGDMGVQFLVDVIRGGAA